MLTRRRWMQTLAVRPSAPNVLVFMTDQESALLPGSARLPNRDRVLQRGVRFANAFCTTPQCSAARASFLTGLMPKRTGVWTNVDNSSLGQPLSPELPNLGHVFRQAGYTTALFGKWHLSLQDKDLGAFGFDVRVDGKDPAVTAAAAEWLRGAKTPWLAWVSLLNPHDIYAVRKEMAATALRPDVRGPVTNLDNLASKPIEQREYVDRDQGRITADFTAAQWKLYRSYYLDLVEKTDVQLGQVLDSIDLDRTIILLTSDHGDQLGEHGLPFKGPFVHDECMRIPLTIAAPGRLKPGVRTDLVSTVDFAPTLAEAAGLRWPTPTDGQSLLRRARRDAVFSDYYAKQKWVNPIRTIRTRDAKLNIYDQTGHREFYDLRRDPGEATNLAAEKLPAMAALERRLNATIPPAAGA
jgi:arylsulfatase A-like enzyme